MHRLSGGTLFTQLNSDAVQLRFPRTKHKISTMCCIHLIQWCHLYVSPHICESGVHRFTYLLFAKSVTFIFLLTNSNKKAWLFTQHYKQASLQKNKQAGSLNAGSFVLSVNILAASLSFRMPACLSISFLAYSILSKEEILRLVGSYRRKKVKGTGGEHAEIGFLSIWGFCILRGN